MCGKKSRNQVIAAFFEDDLLLFDLSCLAPHDLRSCIRHLHKFYEISVGIEQIMHIDQFFAIFDGFTLHNGSKLSL